MKMWAIILALAIGMALLPGFRDKAEITGKVVVTAVGVDVAEGKADSSGVRVSVQAVETMKTAGSLTEQEKNATEVYAVEGRSIAGSMQAFATQTGRGAYILHNKVVALGMEAAKTVPLPRLLDFFMRDLPWEGGGAGGNALRQLRHSGGTTGQSADRGREAGRLRPIHFAGGGTGAERHGRCGAPHRAG